MKNIKENIKENRIVIYLAIELILFQVIGVLALKKYNNPDINHIFINLDIAAILAFFLLFFDKILNKKNKLIDYILNCIILIFVIYSLLPFLKK